MLDGIPLRGLLHSYITLKKLSRINDIERFGWNLDDSLKELSHNDYATILNNSKRYETVTEHILESFLIALLYLPALSHTNKEYDKQKILNMILVHDIGESYTGDYPPMYEKYRDKKEEENEFCKKLFMSGLLYNTSDLMEYLYLWNEWSKIDTNDYNVKIAKEIDAIQLLYKLFTLISEGRLSLTQERICDFWKASKKIQSREGKNIFNILIVKNPNFVETGKKYNIDVKMLV